MVGKLRATMETTEAELAFTMRKMKIEKHDYGWTVENTGEVRIWFIRNKLRYQISCMEFPSRSANFRAAQLHIRNKRLDSERGIMSIEEAFKGYLQIEGPKASTPYNVLGIPEGSYLEVAEAQFRILAKIYHPDVAAQQGPHLTPEFASQKFSEINEAIQELRKNAPKAADA